MQNFESPTAPAVFYRTYSRRDPVTLLRETWDETCERSLSGLIKLGKLDEEETALIRRMQSRIVALPSGRWMWVGGTEWAEQPENYYGVFNCSSTNIVDWESFGLLMNLAMTGCGTGAVLEEKYISQLPVIRNTLNVEVVAEIGGKAEGERQDYTSYIAHDDDSFTIVVGDSRNGWVSAYQSLLELSSKYVVGDHLDVKIDLSNVRPSGEKLKGFGGVANPIKLPQLFGRCAAILNKAVGRKLTAVECCLLIDEAAIVVVAGNLRRSAGMRQGSKEDKAFAVAKDNLWIEKNGQWSIDPERDALRMANHTRVYHHKPTEQECVDAVSKQYFSGEGAIQFAPEAIARSNADLLDTPEKKAEFIAIYCESKSAAASYLKELGGDNIEHRLGRYGLNPLTLAA